MTTPSDDAVVTVWFLHEEGRKELGHTDAARAWTEACALPIGSHERAQAFRCFNPVEIKIRSVFARLAVAKWEQRAGIEGVCVVEHHATPTGLPVKQFKSEAPYTPRR